MFLKIACINLQNIIFPLKAVNLIDIQLIW